VNLQFCTICKRFIIISYEKNERGEAVETGHELDVKVTSSGLVKLQENGSKNIQSDGLVRKHRDGLEEGCW
jgi:hypothetical protein